MTRTTYKFPGELSFATLESLERLEGIAIQTGLRLVGMRVVGNGKVLLTKFRLLDGDSSVGHVFCDLGAILFEVSASLIRIAERIRLLAASPAFGNGSVCVNGWARHEEE